MGRRRWGRIRGVRRTGESLRDVGGMMENGMGACVCVCVWFSKVVHLNGRACGVSYCITKSHATLYRAILTCNLNRNPPKKMSHDSSFRNFAL